MPDFVATCARGAEPPLAEELARLGARDVEVSHGAVLFAGSLEVGYRACLWSRVASKVLMSLASVAAGDPEALYASLSRIPWEDHVPVDGTLAIDCVASRGTRIHTRFYAQKSKDAIVDRLRQRFGRRPSVDTRTPDVRLHLHVDGAEGSLAVDLGGGALHRRGYRPRGAVAPLRETLAAAVLYLAEWPRRAAEGQPLVDPTCGSGTLLVEAAWMAGDVAPGLARRHALGWLGHDRALWGRLVAEAEERRAVGLDRLPPIVGHDVSEEALAGAREALRDAGLAGRVRLEVGRLEDAAPPADAERPGVVVTNPPWGERLGQARALIPLYQALGDTLKQRFAGYTAYVVTTDVLAREIGLRPDAKVALKAGPIDCVLLTLPIYAAAPEAGDDGPAWRKPSPEAEPFENRLKKNDKKLRKWAKKRGVTCYRLYDADIPEFNVAVDRYEDAFVVSEYAPPRKIPASVAAARLRDVMAVVRERYDLDPKDLHLKVRQRQRGAGQYGRVGQVGERVEVREGGHRFLVNLTDYLDTGLFLDHRQLRAELAEHAAGARFLNLFAYTCTATVYVAAAGARSTTSVDVSQTYLDWGRQNLALNGLEGDHRFVREDVARFLGTDRGEYDLVFVAPPSYSRSKRMDGDFDIVRDHPALLGDVGARLAPGGRLYFSSHARGLTLDPALGERFTVEDITARSVPQDFARSPHQTWLLRPR